MAMTQSRAMIRWKNPSERKPIAFPPKIQINLKEKRFNFVFELKKFEFILSCICDFVVCDGVIELHHSK